MRIFFDTNILLDIAIREAKEPDSFAALKLCIEQRHESFLSWHTLSNLSYLISRTEGEKEATIFIEDILNTCTVAKVGHEDALLALQYNNGDLEDALQISSAIACGASLIITRDGGKGFKKSPIPTYTPKVFLKA